MATHSVARPISQHQAIGKHVSHLTSMYMSRSKDVRTHVAHMMSGSAIRCAYTCSLCAALMSLLSRMPGTSAWGGKMHAPATTGPARGPLPASSTPVQASHWSVVTLHHSAQYRSLESSTAPYRSSWCFVSIEHQQLVAVR